MHFPNHIPHSSSQDQEPPVEPNAALGPPAASAPKLASSGQTATSPASQQPRATTAAPMLLAAAFAAAQDERTAVPADTQMRLNDTDATDVATTAGTPQLGDGWAETTVSSATFLVCKCTHRSSAAV